MRYETVFVVEFVGPPLAARIARRALGPPALTLPSAGALRLPRGPDVRCNAHGAHLDGHQAIRSPVMDVTGAAVSRSMVGR